MAYVSASGNPGRFFTGANTVSVSSVSGIFIPFSSLESYSIATSGDIRELTYSVLDKVTDGIANLGSDAPTKMSISRSTSSAGNGKAQKIYTVTFDLNASNTVYDVQDEA